MPVLDSLAVVQGLMPAQRFVMMKTLAQGVAGGYQTTWRYAGNPGAGTVPGTVAGEILTHASAGAQTVPEALGIEYNHLAGAMGSISEGGIAILYDRVWQSGALSPTLTTLQAVNSPTLPARAGTGAWLQLWIEAAGTSTTGAPTTVTVGYTNELGVSGRSGITALNTNINNNRTFPLNLAAGDIGVQSIQSVTFAASQTAGVPQLVLRKQIAHIPLMGIGVEASYDTLSLGLPAIEEEAALEIVTARPAATISQYVNLDLQIIQGY